MKYETEQEIENLKTRFWSKVNILSENECWNWMASFNHDKGQFSYDGVMVLGEDLIPFFETGKFLNKKTTFIERICRNNSCFNPKHLLYLNIESKARFDFWNNVDKNKSAVFYNSERCWEWIGKIDKHGYGRFFCYDYFETFFAHRVSWIINKGETLGLHVLHHCDNRCCVNPNHLFLGTNLDNVHDRDNKDRGASKEKNGNSKLKNKDILEIRNLYKTGNYTQKQIGNMFNIGGRQISYIVNNKNWREK